MKTDQKDAELFNRAPMPALSTISRLAGAELPAGNGLRPAVAIPATKNQTPNPWFHPEPDDEPVDDWQPVVEDENGDDRS